ncbi:hypothetical protein [Marinilabilia rubra]|uniref:hypothetical protein n=1 Tax=Marinilabilia rubra TaxID=2162893 RepID=UPI001E5B62B2|nr:hypothetical protein [Marinilabilia rubra]
MKYPTYILAIFVVLFLLWGCESKKKKGSPEISEGSVEYTISYTPEIMEKSFSFLLPEKMTYYFRDGSERISFKGELGLYSLDFISDHSTDSSSTLLKIINKKMFVPSSESKKLFIFRSLKEGQVKFIKDSTRTILGYESHKATIHLNDKQKTEIEVWYTPEISTPTTNKNTPFSEVPGVMLEFSIYFNDVLFKLTPKTVEKTQLPESLFAVPPDYSATTIEEIEQTIAGILQ